MPDPGRIRVVGPALPRGWTLRAAWFGRIQFERNLRYRRRGRASQPAARRCSAAAGGGPERFYRGPSLLWRDPLAGHRRKGTPSLARTPRFRMVFVMGFTFGLMVWFPMIAGRHRHGGATGLAILPDRGLRLFADAARAGSYWNCFGFDRSAAGVLFCRAAAPSKMLSRQEYRRCFFIYLEVLILTGVTAAWRELGSRPGDGNADGGGSLALYMLALGNISSVHYPRALSPERVSQGGASGRFQGLIILCTPSHCCPSFWPMWRATPSPA